VRCVYPVDTFLMRDEIRDRLAAATGFEWDAGKRPKVQARHDVDPGECEQAFFHEPFLVSNDAAHSDEEPRWRALGRTAAARPLFVVFTMRGPFIGVLAARPMTRKERVIYAQAEAQYEKGDPPIQIGGRRALVLDHG
jgi:uncharacterized protein